MPEILLWHTTAMERSKQRMGALLDMDAPNDVIAEECILLLRRCWGLGFWGAWLRMARQGIGTAWLLRVKLPYDHLRHILGCCSGKATTDGCLWCYDESGREDQEGT